MLCVVGGVGLGAAVGWLAGTKIGGQVPRDASDRRADVERTWAVRGAVFSAALAAWVTPAYGRDRWTDVPQWTRTHAGR